MADEAARAIIAFPFDSRLSADQIRGLILSAQQTADEELERYGLKTKGKVQIEDWSEDRIDLSWKVESLG